MYHSNQYNYRWYSLCSAHREIDPQCHICHKGQWIDENDPEFIADQQLFKDDPDAWREKQSWLQKPQWSRVEHIICPECNDEQCAKVEQYYGDPFPRYIHDCTNCGYTIMESEWDRATD